jgi:hypothetical protein
MTNPTEFAMFGKRGRPAEEPAERLPLMRIDTDLGLFALSPGMHHLLLSCARAGLDSGPILTPEQRALDALLTALMGAPK